MKAAIILCGSGYLDGSEIHEATLCMLHLSKNNVSYDCFAPNQEQTDTVNHLEQSPLNQKRNCLEEAARIARSKIKSINELDSSHYNLLVIPGGFGVAKTLCNFAEKGAVCDVLPEVEKLIVTFNKESKAIIGTCITPALLARVFQKQNLSVKMTLGPGKEVHDILLSMGMESHQKQAIEAVVDQKHKVYTAPAYMDENASIAEVSAGIEKAIQSALK